MEPAEHKKTEDGAQNRRERSGNGRVRFREDKDPKSDERLSMGGPHGEESEDANDDTKDKLEKNPVIPLDTALNNSSATNSTPSVSAPSVTAAQSPGEAYNAWLQKVRRMRMLRTKAEKRGLDPPCGCPDPNCDEVLPDKRQLFQHYIAHHPHSIVPPGTKNTVLCPLCAKSFINVRGARAERIMEAHQRKEHNRPYDVARGWHAGKGKEEQEVLLRQRGTPSGEKGSEDHHAGPSKDDKTTSDLL